ncbi:MAG TPA: hypothetical protein VFY71_10450 [Planctomycetota bacterium]|nr:hypothetical protein [Planctomycetota bacterium]
MSAPDVLLASLLATGRQVLVLLGPFAAAAALLHLLERLLSARLQSRFGWRGVLLTGWLGVPVHELSHAAVCLLFGHRVERMKLFAPDPRTGQLGEVQHAWDRRSVYQQVGRFFIGVAPLVGGALALLLLTRLLGPAGVASAPLPAEGGPLGVARAAADRAGALIAALAGHDVAGRWVTWLYLYLCLCIGAHMSPSSADLRGGLPGLLLLLGLVLATNLVVVALGHDPATGEAVAARLLAPLLALLIVALALGVLCLLLVTLATALLPVRHARA